MNTFEGFPLPDLLVPQVTPCVTIRFPMTLNGERDQRRILLKNLRTETQTLLRKRGTPDPITEKIIRNIEAKTKELLRHPGGKEAATVFADPNQTVGVLLPFPVDSLATVSDNFHVTALFSLSELTDEFVMLALSQNQSRVVKFHGDEAVEIDVPNMPASLRPEDHTTNPQHHLQHRTVTRGFTAIHGNDEENANALRDYMKKVDHALIRFLTGQSVPLVLAGVRENVEAYRLVTQYPELVPGAVSGNVGAMPTSQLRALARPLLHQVEQKHRQPEVQRITELLATGDWKATADVSEILENAHRGNLDSLFAAGDHTLWGNWRAGGPAAVNEGTRSPDNDDLINAAVLLAYSHRTNVHIMPRRAMPEGLLLAGILRH